MISLWMFCTAFLWYNNMRLQLVVGEKGEITKDKTGSWLWDTSHSGNVENWSDQKEEMEIWTRVNTGTGVSTSWFVTPELKLPNTSYLSISGSCDKTPCHLETFGQADSDPDSEKFEFIQNVTLNKFRSNKTATIKKSYPYLRILARAAPPETKFIIYSIKIYYYFCKEGAMYNAYLNKVPSSTTNVSATVQCTDNSVSNEGESRNVTVECTPTGNWTFGSQKCICNKGFHSDKHECSRCPIDHYKSTAGDEKCQKCPDGKTNNTMHTKCECKENRYVGDDKDGPCYGMYPFVCDNKIRKCWAPFRLDRITLERSDFHTGFVCCLHYTTVIRCGGDMKRNPVCTGAVLTVNPGLCSSKSVSTCTSQKHNCIFFNIIMLYMSRSPCLLTLHSHFL